MVPCIFLFSHERKQNFILLFSFLCVCAVFSSIMHHNIPYHMTRHLISIFFILTLIKRTCVNNKLLSLGRQNKCWHFFFLFSCVLCLCGLYWFLDEIRIDSKSVFHFILFIFCIKIVNKSTIKENIFNYKREWWDFDEKRGW